MTPPRAAALDAAGLRGGEHVPVRVLSQASGASAALARLPLGTALWILDEPFNALDNHRVAAGPHRRAPDQRWPGGADQPPGGGLG
jgi:ABC-type transport system involved in cytochrome c biogenesis ATPase subunit